MADAPNGVVAYPAHLLSNTVRPSLVVPDTSFNLERPSLKIEVSLKDLCAVERRGDQRISGPFPALALDLSPDCERLGVYTVLEDFSAGGFRMLRERPAALGGSLVVTTRSGGG